jgi:hypothetical protein
MQEVLKSNTKMKGPKLLENDKIFGTWVQELKDLVNP